LINLRALRRLVEATDDSAMQFFMTSFSASRLKGFPFFLLPFLSFLDALPVVGEDEEKKDPRDVVVGID